MPWWYLIDMIGYSIKLPLTQDMIELLEAADLDPPLVREVLEASDDRSRGIFKEASESGLLPSHRLKTVYLCEGCRTEQTRLAWTEELSQLYNFVNALEKSIINNHGHHELWWTQVRNEPEKLCQLRFREIPWPVRDTALKVHPSQISKLEVLRFYFSHCILRFLYPESTDKIEWATHLDSLRDRWNTLLFETHLSPPSTPRTSDQEMILEAVSMIESWLREIEDVHGMEILDSIRPHRVEKVVYDAHCSENQRPPHSKRYVDPKPYALLQEFYFPIFLRTE